MKTESMPTEGPSLEHALTTMGVVVALAGLLAMLASAFGWSPMDAMPATWRWLILGLAATAHRIHRWIAPLFWHPEALIALRHDLPDTSVRA
jgi:hypothetical protein